MKNESEIIIYRAKNGEIKLKAQFQNESIWLSQKQMVNLFETERSVITKHLNNIFKSNELDEKSNVQKMHIANSDKSVKFYSLDAVISVGYRVSSKKATDFRIWATKTLRQYLTKGYIINSHLLESQARNYLEAKNIIQLIGKKSKAPELAGHQDELLDVISEFTASWKILSQFDEGTVEIKKFRKTTFKLNFYKCRDIIEGLKEELIEKRLTGKLFGLDKEDRLSAIIATLYQTYDENELYGSIEEKAANLLYFVIKDHPFVDGNKRIGSLLFLYFLEKNSYLFRNNGTIKINDKTIVTLALLVAASNPKEKDSIIRLIINLIQD